MNKFDTGSKDFLGFNKASRTRGVNTLPLVS